MLSTVGGTAKLALMEASMAPLVDRRRDCLEAWDTARRAANSVKGMLEGSVDIRDMNNINFNVFTRAAELAEAEHAVYSTCCSGSVDDTDIAGRPRWGAACTRCSRSEPTKDALRALMRMLRGDVIQADHTAAVAEAAVTSSLSRIEAARSKQADIDAALWEDEMYVRDLCESLVGPSSTQ